MYNLSADPISPLVLNASDVLLETALEAADVCFISWRKKTPSERALVIAKAAAILRLRQDEFAFSITQEAGKLNDQAHLEIAITADVIDYYATHAESLKSPAPLQLAQNLLSEDIVPFGIVFGIQPLSFPYFQLARFIAPSLMAGNVVVIQHAGSDPASALAFEKLWVEAGAPAGIYTNLLVSNEQSSRLRGDPRIQCISNNGTEAVKRITELPNRRPTVNAQLLCAC
jgi:succinate-semialdehyde dehydrogenase / glutarate-semialdehyde dehydrogenase